MTDKKLIIFGTGSIGQIAKQYFEDDSPYQVVAFTVDDEYRESESFEGLPLISFEDIHKVYSPDNHEMFIALSYSEMNRLRESKLNDAKSKGYKIASYVSSSCTYLSKYPPGENAFIFEDNTIQPFVQIKDNVTLWSGNHIGHHSIIESNNFISSHVVISGHCTIKSYCFLGVNATLAHQVTLEEGTLLGAGVVMSKDSESNRVYVSARPTMIDKTSDQIKL